MLTLTKDLRIISKDLNFNLEYNEIVREHFMTNPDNIGTKRWQTIGYFTTFSSISSFLEKNTELVDYNSLVELHNVTNKIELAIEGFNSHMVNEERYAKVFVGEKWQIVGTKMVYRMIKKEQIKSSRFTKEENVGKDKFISIGFAPNISIALKTILNEVIFDFLSKTTESSYDELIDVIDAFINDFKNLTIEETTIEEIEVEDSNDNYDIESYAEENSEESNN